MFPKCHAGSSVLIRFGETGMTHGLEEESELWTQGLFLKKKKKKKKVENKDKLEMGLSETAARSLIRYVETSH